MRFQKKNIFGNEYIRFFAFCTIALKINEGCLKCTFCLSLMTATSTTMTDKVIICISKQNANNKNHLTSEWGKDTQKKSISKYFTDFTCFATKPAQSIREKLNGQQTG